MIVSSRVPVTPREGEIRWAVSRKTSRRIRVILRKWDPRMFDAIWALIERVLAQRPSEEEWNVHNQDLAAWRACTGLPQVRACLTQADEKVGTIWMQGGDVIDFARDFVRAWNHAGHQV